MKLSRFGRRCVLAVLMAAAGPQIHGAVVESTWNNSLGNNDWNAAANWSPGQVPSNGTPVDTTYNVTLTNAGAANLNTSRTIDNLTLQTGSDLVVLSSRTLTLAANGALSSTGGVIHLNSTGGATTVNFGDNTSLSGDLTVIPTNFAVNRFQGSSVANQLTIQAGSLLTISGGQFNLGANAMHFHNDGEIHATGGGVFIIDVTGSGSSSNGGMIRLSGGGNGQLAPGVIDNTTGTFQVQDNSIMDFVGVTLLGGQLITTDSGLFRFETGRTAQLGGHVTLDATIRMSSGGSNTDLIFANGASLLGAATFQLSNFFTNRWVGQTVADLLTIKLGADIRFTAAPGSIRGSMNLGANAMLLDNKGTLTADAATFLVIDPSAGDSFNSGVIRAINGGRFEINPGVIQNSGTVRADGMDSIISFNGGTVIGGQITTTGGGLILIENGRVGHLGGNIALNATARMTGVNNNTDLNIADGSSLSGHSTFQLTDTFTNRWVGENSTDLLTIQPGAEIRFATAPGAPSGKLNIGVNFLRLDNRGAMIAEAGTYVLIDPIPTDSFNSGVIRAINGGRFEFNAGEIQGAGRVEADGAGSLISFNGGTLSGARLNTTNDGLFLIDNSRTGHLAGQTIAAATFRMAATFNNTELRFADGASITGDATFQLSNTFLNRWLGENSTDLLTINPGSEVRFAAAPGAAKGSLNLGTNFIRLDNQGTMTADTDSYVAIDPIGADSINTGVIRAINGGRFDFNGGVFQNAGGTISAEASSIIGFNGGTVIGGRISTTGDGLMLVENGKEGRFGGEILADATFRMAGTGNNTDMIFLSDAAFSGDATVELTNTFVNRWYGDVSADALTIRPGAEIRFTAAPSAAVGNLHLGTNFMRLDIQGTMTADANSFVAIDPFGADSINTGVIRAINGGRFDLNGGVFQNAGGTVRAEASSIIGFNGGTVIDGQITTSGDGIILIDSGRRANLGGDITLGATFRMAAVGGNSDLAFADGTSLSGDATFQLSNTFINRWYGDNSSDLLTIKPGAEIRFVAAPSAAVGSLHLGTNSMRLDNQGTLTADTASFVAIDPGSADTFNSGVIRAINGGRFDFNTGTYQNSGAIKASGAGSAIRFTSGANIRGTGELIGESGGSLQVLAGSSINTDGALRLIDGGQITLNNQTITVGSLQVDATTSLGFSGTIGLTQSLSFEQTDESLFALTAASNLRVVRTVGGFEWVRLEVGGEDLGTDPVAHVGDPAGFINNFHLPRLELASGARAVLVDLLENQPGDGAPDALYVDNLVLGTNALLNLRGLNLYYKTLTGSISQIVDLPDLQPGDLNLDGRVDDLDIDLLFTQINGGSTDPFFDLTGDSLVNQLDVDYLVEGLQDTFYGDADLNRSVSIGDLTVMAEFFNLPGHWAQGDFTGNGGISIGDLTLLAENFGSNHPLIGQNLIAVPLPGAGWAGLGLMALAGIRGFRGFRRRTA